MSCDTYKAPTDDDLLFGKIVVIIPKFVGFLSIFCSSFVINHICRAPGQLSKVTNRLLLGLTCADVLYTFIMPFMSSWMVPKDLNDSCGNEVFVYMNAGNVHTCSMQGFLDQFGCKCSWTYNAVLSFSYFVAIRFRQGEKTLVRYEKLLHGVPIVFGLLAAIIPLPYQAYNYTGTTCWLAVSPQGCETKGDACERGHNIGNLVVWLSFLPMFVTQAVVFLSMLGVFLNVYKVERKTVRYGAPNASGGLVARLKGARTFRLLKRSKRVALKCALYVLAFQISWFFNMWGVIQHLIDPDSDQENAGTWAAIRYILNLALLSSYGIWSSIAYFILPFLKVRKTQSEWSFFEKVKRTVLPPPKMGSMGMRGPRLRISWFGGATRHSSEGVGVSTSNVVVEPQKTYFEEEDDFGHGDDEENDDKCDNDNIIGDGEAGDGMGESGITNREERETMIEVAKASTPKRVAC